MNERNARVKISWNFLFGCAVGFLAAGPAVAEHNATTPNTGTILLFDTMYSFTGINFETTTFAGGVNPARWCGYGLSFVEGATTSLDRLYLIDECDGNGEDSILLTGTTPGYEFTAASTASYVVQNSGNGQDPYTVDWISDSGNLNLRFTKIYGRAATYDHIAIDASGIPHLFWTTASDSDQVTAFQRQTSDPNSGVPTGSCTNLTANRLYIGGVRKSGGVKYFAYQAFNLASNSLVNTNTVVNLTALGTPDQTAPGDDRDLRGMAYDGTYFYVAAKKPGVDETWVYRYNSLPDQGASESSHPDTTPASSMLSGGAGSGQGLAYLNTPSGTPQVRPDRSGFTCGRNIAVAGHAGTRPVFYFLAEGFLYTLVPTLPVEHWQAY